VRALEILTLEMISKAQIVSTCYCTHRSRNAARYMINKTGITRKSIFLIKAASSMEGRHSTSAGLSTLSEESYCPGLCARTLEASSRRPIECQYGDSQM